MARLKFIEDKDIIRRRNSLAPYIPFKDFGATGEFSTYPNFTICVTDEKAEELIDAGYKIKDYVNKDGDVFHQLKINARFDNIPPKVFEIPEGKRRKIQLDGESIVDLQNMDIVEFEGSVSLSKGGACYLASGYFTVARNPIDDKYSFDEEDDLE